MKYTYEYPKRVQSINGLRRGALRLNDEHIAQTHSELMNRLDDPRRTVTVQATVDATTATVWAIAGSPERLFSHQPRFAALTTIEPGATSEGSRFVIHRMHDGRVYDRAGEVLVSIPQFQLSVSDIDVADASVSGHFPSMFTVRVEDADGDSERSIVRVSYTTIGVIPPLMPAVLLLQLRSIQERAEEASQLAR